MPDGVVAVSESGLQSRADLERLAAAGYGAFLIGERFMTDARSGGRDRELLIGARVRFTRALRRSLTGHVPEDLRLTNEGDARARRGGGRDGARVRVRAVEPALRSAPIARGDIVEAAAGGRARSACS